MATNLLGATEPDAGSGRRQRAGAHTWLLGFVAEWRARHMARQLKAMPAWQLRDIGIDYGEIERAVRWGR